MYNSHVVSHNVCALGACARVLSCKGNCLLLPCGFRLAALLGMFTRLGSITTSKLPVLFAALSENIA